MCLNTIQADIHALKEQCQAKPCCKRHCATILTAQLVSFCRSQYVLLRNFEERRNFLDKHRSRKSADCCWNIFFVEQPNGETTQLCRDVWLFCYGISRATYKKRNRLAFDVLKAKKTRRDGTSVQEQSFMQWLIRQAKKIGDKMPHGDGLTQTQIRLPYPNKQIVHFLFEEFASKNLMFVDKGKKTVLSYEDTTQLWKNHPDLRHIKMMRFKGSFSVCKTCLAYELAIKGQLSISERENLDRNFFGHITETKKERSQYAKDQIKCAEDQDKMVIILDAIDKYKTTFPFFINAPKSALEGATLTVTKMTAAMAHGFGAGVYCFWATDQLCHDTNYNVEVLRRTLLKIEELHGDLPRKLYLQLDNASDNRSAQFLAFIAFMVEMGSFDKVKVSYLIVGHTHEIIDQWFSVISKFVKKVMMQILTIAAFFEALCTRCFKTEKCIPKHVEQIQYCYDTKKLSKEFMDKNIRRFDLDEETDDKVHHFIFRRNDEGKCIMNYKLKRYQHALYPRRYPHVGATHISPDQGPGTVVNFEAFRDEGSKQKFWVYHVVYSKDDGNIEEKVTLPAKDASIVMFPHIDIPLPDSFQLAPYKANHLDTLHDQKLSIHSIFQKLDLTATHKSDLEWWDSFFNSVTNGPNFVANVRPFSLPKSFNTARQIYPTRLPLPLDEGIREVDVVESAEFRSHQRKRATTAIEAEVSAANRMDVLEQGMFVVVKLKPCNADWYPWPFVIAEIDRDVSNIDTTNASTEFQIQVYRPCGTTPSLDKKFIKWQGRDNIYFRPTIERGLVKAIVKLHASSKKLTKESKQLINSATF
jgi:hypothetical protein